jgi:hypothetical protein
LLLMVKVVFAMVHSANSQAHLRKPRASLVHRHGPFLAFTAITTEAPPNTAST